MVTCREEIEEFLKMVREAVVYKNCDFIERRKNIQTILNLGITLDDVYNSIYDLTVKDYISGPEKDHRPEEPDDIWIFKKDIYGNIIYIKIKIVQINDVLKIISFHIDES